MDAIALLKSDHETVEKLFKEFEALTERAEKGQAELAERITEELIRHAAIEEQIFYPAIRAAIPDLDLDVREGLEEHHVAEQLLGEVQQLDSSHERFRPKVLVLIEAVRHHVEEEEQELFPTVQEQMDAEVLEELGERMAEAKAQAPTKPHPRSPDQPPLNLVTDAVASLLDRLRDANPLTR
jgi:hemerythrin-like domain-containing protein